MVEVIALTLGVGAEGERYPWKLKGDILLLRTCEAQHQYRRVFHSKLWNRIKRFHDQLRCSNQVEAILKLESP